MKELYKKHRARFLITGMVILLLMCTVISLDFYVYPNASSEYGWIVFLSVGERPATVVNLIKAQFFSAEMLKEALNKSTSDQRRANPPTPIRQWGFGE